MKREKWLAVFALSACVVTAGICARMLDGTSAAQSTNARMVPVFEADANWPKLPNSWVMGNVSKVAVDHHDNVWMIHRPRTVPVGKIAAPPVVELDKDGKFVQAWGGEGAGYDWPDTEHNVLVDYKDNVWISGISPNGQTNTKRSDDMLLKFTNNGKFLMEIGGRSVSHGSKDPKSVNKPGDLFVSGKTNELYVADGYGNRRVIVFDADTGAFKRMWGAFGKPPQDDAKSGGPGPWGVPADAKGVNTSEDAGPSPLLDMEGPGSDRFSSPVHSVVVSNDDIVYVADRSNRRVQLFTPQGKYLKQLFINRAGPAPGSACGLAFSADRDQQFLYVSDYGNSHIVVVNRKTLEILYQFGKRSAAPGDFEGVHHIAVDSEGNLYTAEVAPGARAQRFIFKGLSPKLPPNALTAAQLSAKP